MTPPCARCGQPLRWFPEQYAWGCDACQQMFPVGGAPGTPVRSAAPPTMATRGGSRTALWVGLGAAAVVTGIVIAVVATSGGSSTSTSTGTGTGTASAALPAIDAGPAIPSTGIAECDKVAALRVQVEGCAAMTADTRKTALDMADNNLSAADGATGEYADYVRPRCAGTASALADWLSDAGCMARERARATGYSVPVPSGWQVIRENGQLPSELILEERMPGIGGTMAAGIFIELAPYVEKADASDTAADCRSLAEYVARNQSATLDEHGLVTTKIGPACLNRVHDGRERRLGLSVNVSGKHIVGATCTYDLAAPEHPAACVEIVDGLTLD